MILDILKGKATKMLIGSAVLAATFCFAQDDVTQEEDHIKVGTRLIPQAEWVKIQENKAQLVQKLESGEELTQEEQEIVGDQEQLVSKSMAPTTYYTTHNGVFHHPIAVSLLGDNVGLEDGSVWSVASSDRYQTLNWMTGDVIIILPNDSFFSSYQYRLVNVNTGAKVRVNLELGPIYNGVFTHWIVAINYNYREICLEDGSVWQISSWDDSIFRKWLPNDTIIIGINDGWFSGSNPNMLINVNMNNHIMGSCVN